jgi:hypothetical protein
MDSEGAISGHPSAISSDAVDPLANAHCPQCGYSLRGLPENRCPECGRVFDPAEFTGTFVPRWPELMAWYLAACIIAQLLNVAPSLLQWNPYPLLPHGTAAQPLKDMVNLAALAQLAAIGLLGPICLIGLSRRRDWARKGYILVFGVAALGSLSYLEPIRAYIRWALESREGIDAILSCLAFAARGLAPALVTLFLLTGLRRRSLMRTGSDPAALPRCDSSQLKRDWLLLMVLILCGLGVAWACAGWSSLRAIQWTMRLAGVTGPISRGTDLLAITAKLQIAGGLAIMAASAAIWLRPSTVRSLTAAVAATVIGIRVFEFCACPKISPPVLVPTACLVVRLLATLIPFLALALFAFLAISREDIQRLRAQE